MINSVLPNVIGQAVARVERELREMEKQVEDEKTEGLSLLAKANRRTRRSERMGSLSLVLTVAFNEYGKSLDRAQQELYNAWLNEITARERKLHQF